MAIKLPDTAALKRVPKPVWVVVAGVVLAVLYLRFKGTGASASAGTTASSDLTGGGGGGGGGGGDLGTSVTTAPTATTTATTPETLTDPFAGMDPGALLGTTPSPGGTQSPLDGLPGALTPRQGGANLIDDVTYNLTGPERNALVVSAGEQAPPSIDFAAQSQQFGASAPAYGSPTSGDYINQLYDRLRILSNYYTSGYGANPSVVGNQSLGESIQLTQRQIYNYVVGGQAQTDASIGGVPTPYNQFIQNEGVYVAGSPAVRKLIEGAKPAGAPSANDLGVYQAAVGTPNLIATYLSNPANVAINTGETSGPSRTGVTTLSLSQFNAQNRAGVLSRATEAGKNPTTAGVNATVAADYKRYLASLGV